MPKETSAAFQPESTPSAVSQIDSDAQYASHLAAVDAQELLTSRQARHLPDLSYHPESHPNGGRGRYRAWPQNGGALGEVQQSQSPRSRPSRGGSSWAGNERGEGGAFGECHGDSGLPDPLSDGFNFLVKQGAKLIHKMGHHHEKETKQASTGGSASSGTDAVAAGAGHRDTVHSQAVEAEHTPAMGRRITPAPAYSEY